MKKILIKKKYILKFDSNIYYLFKKKTKKSKYIYSKINYDLILQNFKIYFFFNIYANNLYNILFLKQYNIKKNLIKIFFILYNLLYEKIKIKINKFFFNFCKKAIIKNLLILQNSEKNIKNSYLYLKKLKFKKFFYKINITQYNLSVLNYKRKFMKSFIFTKKKWKKKFKKINIKISFYFFNRYQKNNFFNLIKYFIKFFDIKLKKLFFWYLTKFYSKILKYTYIYIEYIIKKLIVYIKQEFKLLISLLDWKKKYNKNFFYYVFFFDIEKKRFLKNFKIDASYQKLEKLIDFNFFKKNWYSLYIFNKKKIKN